MRNAEKDLAECLIFIFPHSAFPLPHSLVPETCNSLLGQQTVSFPPDGFDQRRIPNQGAYFLAQLQHVDIHRSGFDVRVGIMPHLGEKLLFGDDPFLIPIQVNNDIHFPAGKFHRLIPAPGFQVYGDIRVYY